MGCHDVTKRDLNNAKDAINRALYKACECASESCECRDVAVQAQIAAQASAESASSDANQSEAIWNDFQTRYLGAYPSDPPPAAIGALYFNTTSNSFLVWDGSSWVASGITGAAYLANNQTFTGQNIFSVNSSSEAVRITQVGSGNALLVEDSANPDASPFVVSSNGNVGIGTTAPSYKVDIVASSNGVVGTRTVNSNSQSNAQTVIQIGNDTNSAAAAIRLNSSTNTGFGGVNALSLINGLNAPIILATSGIERVIVEGDGDVGIGITPNSSAILDVSSTTKGFLPPRMTTVQRDAIPSPAEGLVVYNTTTDEINIFNGTAWIVAGSAQTDVQVFTSSGTWTKPANAKSVHVITIAGGGGGASGRVTAGTHGGGAGAGGGLTERTIPASVLGATETVTIGLGGAGGASQTAANSQNAIGTNGGDSSFGTWVIAGGGGGGGITGIAGGASPRAMWPSVNGSTGGTNAAGNSGAISVNGAAGGGGGAGIDGAGTTQYNGGLGGAVLSNLLSGGQAVGGTAPGGNGANGQSFTSYVQAGCGGGGGASSSSGNAGNGGNGGLYGGGGGGGGACKLGFSSGAGGSGANGVIVVTTYF